MIDALIVIFRFPVGVVVSVLAAVFYVALVLPISTAILPLAFLYAAVFWSKQEIQDSWIGYWPFLKGFCEKVLGGIWKWVFNTEHGIGDPFN
jgi:hypothetical protein